MTIAVLTEEERKAIREYGSIDVPAADYDPAYWTNAIGGATKKRESPMEHKYYTPGQQAAILIITFLLICCLCGGAAYFMFGHPGIS